MKKNENGEILVLIRGLKASITGIYEGVPMWSSRKKRILALSLCSDDITLLAKNFGIVHSWTDMNAIRTFTPIAEQTRFEHSGLSSWIQSPLMLETMLGTVPNSEVDTVDER